MKANKSLDKEIAKAYHRLGDRLEIKITDIPELFKMVRAAIKKGSTMDQAMRAAILIYCNKPN